jgi:hypothetical protein
MTDLLRYSLWAFSFWATQTLAAPPKGVHFYKNPQSVFPSGQLNMRELQNTEVKELVHYSFLVQHNYKRFWVKASDVVRDVDLANQVLHTPTGTYWKVLHREESWIQAQSAKGELRWLALKDLKPTPEDSGFLMNVISTSLREKPDWKAPLRKQIEPLNRFQVLEMSQGWAYVSSVSDAQTQGWIDLNNVIMKADFASFAQAADGEWKPIAFREQDQLVTTSGTRIPIPKISKWVTKSDRAIIVRSLNSFALPLRTHLQILKIDSDRWGASQVRGHGMVYWRKGSEESLDFSIASKQHITTEDLLNREITSLAFHPKNPQMGLVSAGGIFFTRDGIKWQALPQFKEQNFPVGFGPQQEWLIGAYWSRDDGKTFHNYISWERLSQLVTLHQASGARHLRLQEVRAEGPSGLSLLLDTGTHTYRFAADVSRERAINWRLAANK